MDQNKVIGTDGKIYTCKQRLINHSELDFDDICPYCGARGYQDEAYCDGCRVEWEYEQREKEWEYIGYEDRDVGY